MVSLIARDTAQCCPISTGIHFCVYKQHENMLKRLFHEPMLRDVAGVQLPSDFAPGRSGSAITRGALYEGASA